MELNYKEMFESLERKLVADLEFSNKIYAGYKQQELNTSFLEGRIDYAESAIIFAEELRRIYA